MLTAIEAAPVRPSTAAAAAQPAAEPPHRGDFSERTALLRERDGDALHAVVSVPQAARGTGVVIVVGGPQYRVGSHRQFVLLARALAAAGFAVLRFDCRGMGDSSGEPAGFEGLDDDIAAAIDGLFREVPKVRRVVLWGLCDGAAAALLYVDARHDSRVSGLCLANPWVRSAATLARTHVRHYYVQRLRQRDFWAKLLRGRVAAEALTSFLRSLRSTLPGGSSSSATTAATGGLPFRDRMAVAWRRFDGDVLLLLSGRDLTAREFSEHARVDPAWRGVVDGPRTERLELPAADHTFADPLQRAGVETRVIDWITRHHGDRGA